MAVRFLSSVTLADSEVPDAAPDQPAKLWPLVTRALTGRVVPQSNVPSPLAVPPEVDVTVSVYWIFVKVAVTVRSWSIVTVGPSDQLSSSQQALGAAVAVAGSPSS